MFDGERKQEQGTEGKLFTVCISCVAGHEQNECSLHEVPSLAAVFVLFFFIVLSML